MHNIVCPSCRQKSQVTEEEYKACNGVWTCICKKPVPEGMVIRQCGLGQHSPTYQPAGTYIYNCQACRDEIDASKSIKVKYGNLDDSPTYQRQKNREYFVPQLKIKTADEYQILLLEEISKKLDKLIRPEIIPHELGVDK